MSEKKSSSDHLTDEQILESLVRRADFEDEHEALSPGRYEVELQLVPIACWKCHRALVAVRGYRFVDVFVPLADISDTRTVAAFVAELRSNHPIYSRLGPSRVRTRLCVRETQIRHYRHGIRHH